MQNNEKILSLNFIFLLFKQKNIKKFKRYAKIYLFKSN